MSLDGWYERIKNAERRTEYEKWYATEQAILDYDWINKPWLSMNIAPDMSWPRLIFIMAKLKDGSVCRCHYAQDLSGEYQPAFSGWFNDAHNEIKPVAWRPKNAS